MSTRDVTVRLRADIANFQRNMRTAGVETDASARKLEDFDRRGSKALDSVSGRASILADVLLTLGPATLPIGAVAVPAVTTLASSLGFAVVAAGSAVLAFQGVGDTLEAVNKSQLEPTTANIEAAEAAMKRLSPAARDMVDQLDALGGLGTQLRDAGAESLFPGLIDALDTISERGPEVEDIIRAVNAELGDIASDSATSLNSKRWDDFFRLVENQAPHALDAMADATGNVVHGLSEILEAFVPLNNDGLDWLVNATEGFDDWATGLKKTDGFKDFVAYVRKNGPQVEETVGAVATALLDVLEAAAPLGGPGLKAIETFADAISVLADSDFATPLLAGIAAMRTINRLAPITAGSMALLGGGAAGGKPGRPGKSPVLGTPLVLATAVAAGGILGERKQTTQDIENYTKAYQGLDDAMVRLAARRGLHADEWLEFGKKVGLSNREMIDAATGDAATLEGIRGKVKDYVDDLSLKDQALNTVTGDSSQFVKALENQNDRRVEGLKRASEAMRDQRKEVDFLSNDLVRMRDIKANPKIDIDDRAARQKRREADDWILDYGRKNADAKAGIIDVDRRKKSKQADDWITGWGGRDESATVDADAAAAFKAFYAVTGELNDLNGDRATVYIDTVRTVTGPLGGAIFSQAAAGGYVTTYGPAGTPPAELTEKGIAP